MAAETLEYEDIEITVTDPSGKEKFYPLVSFTRRFTPFIDGSYGADADGRRGVRVEAVEDDRAVDVFISGLPLSSFDKSWQTAIEAGLQVWLENHHPDLGD
jgi:hypothetical protein